jgi:DNA repair protein RadC
MESISIKSWAEDDRPREKLLMKGKHSLSDAELLAIIIGSGTRKKSAVELSKEILREFNNDLGEFSRVDFNELLNFNGIGSAKAINILAALELGRRKKLVEKTTRIKFNSPYITYEFMRQYLGDLDHEEFYVIYCNSQCELIKIEQISSGGLTGTVVDGRLVFRTALLLKATTLILVHNHPSGINEPSDADISLTVKLRDFGKMINISIVDHLIYTDNGYFSFFESGKLNV